MAAQAVYLSRESGAHTAFPIVTSLGKPIFAIERLRATGECFRARTG
jgi:hypothetical protein